MKNKVSVEIKVILCNRPGVLAAVPPLKDTPDAEAVRRTLESLTSCGDCEPGGFGSIYGFGPT
jgi:hypothetical protein